ncbi:hypothetical protein PWT90_08810 [Aphanocladium album]|nr:hypothetical protein PWT90_08810 [Aphanocladium album]
MPKLRHLTLMIQCNLSAASLLALAKYNSAIESCVMPYMFDFEQLGMSMRSRPLFPNIVELGLGGLLSTPASENDVPTDLQITALVTAALMRYHMPKLSELIFESDDEYPAAVLNAFEPH